MFGLRIKQQMTTKYSPYFLMFGREARYPSEIPEDYRVTADCYIIPIIIINDKQVALFNSIVLHIFRLTRVWRAHCQLMK